MRVANDLAAQGGRLDLLPQSISLRLECAISALGVAAGVGNSLADARATSATTTGTDRSAEAVHNAIDVGVSLKSTGTSLSKTRTKQSHTKPVRPTT